MNRQEQMDMLKQEYEQVEVPEKALAAIQTGIIEAKKEHKNMKQWNRFGKVAAAAAVIAVIAVPNISPQAAMAVADVPILNKVVQIVTLNRYQQTDETGKYEVNVKTPELQVEGDAKLQSSVGEINTQVQAYADKMIADFQEEMEQQGGVYGLDIQYNVVTDTDNWFTLEITTLETMASGAQSVRYYNLDKASGEYIQLADLFPQGTNYVMAISENIKTQMLQRMAEDENQIYNLNSEIVPEDDFKQIKADQSFYLNQKGDLVIAFDEYEVAPGYMGPQQFVIDDSVVEALQH